MLRRAEKSRGGSPTENRPSVVDTILVAIALGMAVAGVVLGSLNEVPVQTNVFLLGIGLFTLALAVLRGGRM